MRSIIIELTHGCTRGTCVFCSSMAKPASTLYPGHPLYGLDHETALRVVREAIELGAQRIEVSGGEPLLRLSTVVEIAKLATDSGARVAIFSSGTDPELVTKLIESLGREQLERLELHFSVHSHSREIHAELVGRDDLERVLASTRMLAERGVFVGWHFTVTKLNWRDAPRVAELANRCGARMVSFLRLVPQGRARESWHRVGTDAETLAEFLKQMLRYLEKYEGRAFLRFGCPINWFFLLAPRERLVAIARRGRANVYPPPRCSAGEEHLAVEPDGTALPCSAFKGLYQYALGNVYRQSLGDVIESERAERFRKLKKTLPDKCRACPYREICGAKCVAQRVYSSTELDPVCPALRNNVARVENRLDYDYKRQQVHCVH